MHDNSFRRTSATLFAEGDATSADKTINTYLGKAKSKHVQEIVNVVAVRKLGAP